MESRSMTIYPSIVSLKINYDLRDNEVFYLSCGLVTLIALTCFVGVFALRPHKFGNFPVAGKYKDLLEPTVAVVLQSRC
jgi:hypothetical protein